MTNGGDAKPTIHDDFDVFFDRLREKWVLPIPFNMVFGISGKLEETCVELNEYYEEMIKKVMRSDNNS